GACADPMFDRSSDTNATDTTSRFGLQAADGQRWMLYARAPGMSENRLRQGDKLDLALAASQDDSAFYITVSQTVTLASRGKLVLFVSTVNELGIVEPDLGSFGIDVTKGSPVCDDGAARCGARGYRTVVQSGGEITLIVPGGTGRIGDVWLSVESS